MKDKIKEVIISMTNRCNLRCAMCEIPRKDVSGELDEKEMQALVADAVGMCPDSIVLSGGEPLLRKDIFDLIAFVRRNGINVCLASNGLLLTDDVARRLSSAGVGVVNISIEGDEKTHDALRGAGSFIKAVNALKNLTQHKIEATIASTVSGKNYRALPSVMTLAHDLGVTTVKFQPFSDIFLLNKGGHDGFFTDQALYEDIHHTMGVVAGLAEEYRIATNPKEYLYHIPAYLCGKDEGAIAMGCAALWTSCPISAEGDVFPCWVLSKHVVGNVKKRKLSDLWGSPEHEALRRSIVEKGCPGCMMSCYDRHFADEQKKPSILMRKVPVRAGAYRDLGTRIYQKGKYLLKKIISRIRIKFLMRYPGERSKNVELLRKIGSLKERIQKKAADL